MPIYEYHCPNCGVFSDLTVMQQAAKPARCPSCGALAPRVLSVPRLTTLSRAQKIAGDRNEKSAHEPTRVRRQTCATGNCGHTHHRRSPAQRPWMLGH
ncbi:MAG: zinc ribbon domain-containing protein [Gammaproteobacteria bacterium]|nr:zinc ribbon domain-containing protein [Gammaproteobacteria bacterium]